MSANAAAVRQFREYLKKIGSGEHTSVGLSRAEAADATRMMLLEEATPAQIGAFAIAHRIKRPTPEELAGMLDAYEALGPHLEPVAAPVTVFGVPYDGRSRTAPVLPITVLLLAAAGVSVVLHGGDRMPTKYGVPLVEIWRELGVEWAGLSLGQARSVLARAGVTLVYLPQHFPLAARFVAIREQLGKRPPAATLELVWSPYGESARLISGFVHPPTEARLRQTLALRGSLALTTVKGLEGSCDLARNRPAIVGIARDGKEQRSILHPTEYGFGGSDVGLDERYIARLQAVLAGKSDELAISAVWNGGFYLWHCGVCDDLRSGFELAKEMLADGRAAAKLAEIAEACRAEAG